MLELGTLRSYKSGAQGHWVNARALTSKLHEPVPRIGSESYESLHSRLQKGYHLEAIFRIHNTP